MRNWKSIVKGIVAVVAVLQVVGSALDDAKVHSPSADGIVVAAATFFSVVSLHWLLWRFIVPPTSGVPANFSSLFHRQPGRGFFTGTISTGYVGIALYCGNLSGYLERVPAHVGLLLMGLFFIGLG